MRPIKQYKIDKRIGAKLKKWREAAEETQWDVANFLGDAGFTRSRHMVSLYECGHSTCPNHIIEVWQNHYKVPENDKILKI